MIRIILIIAALTLSSASYGNDSTKSISAKYFAQDLALKYDSLNTLYDDKVSFSDPSGDVFGPPLSEGPVIGKDKVIAMQKSWRLSNMAFDEALSFTVGEYSVRQGELEVTFTGAKNSNKFPFVTVHRIVNGKVAERLDFGGYVGNLVAGDKIAAQTKETLATSRTMLSSYLTGDLATQTTLLAENIHFQDPTALFYGEENGKPIVGKQTLLKEREGLYQRISEFTFDVQSEFASNHHAVFSGTISYVFDNKYRFVQPAIMAFEVKNGKITRHWDFVDYSLKPKLIAAAK